jgi:5-methylcytosine-specific restriction endonuclease McrA
MSTKEIETILREGVVCPYCRESLTPRLVSIDHIQPRSRGGVDSLENIHFTCLSCNLAKGDMTDQEFTIFMKFVDEFPEIGKRIIRRLKIAGASYYNKGRLHKQ